MAIETVETTQEDRVLLHTNWAGYIKIGDAVGEAPGVRITYDQGSLEIMTVGVEHETIKSLVGQLLEIYMEEADVTFQSGGNATFKRKAREKGFEPDECYWLANYRAMLGVKKWNPRRHPPPDLAIEVEVSSGFIPRLPIYAAIGVPEVWWYHDEQIDILRLTATGEYEPVAQSPTLPLLSPDVLLQHVRLEATLPTSQIRRRFRDWVRQRLQA